MILAIIKRRLKARWKYNVVLFLGAVCIGILLYIGKVQVQKVTEREVPTIDSSLETKYSKIVFAGGCFWCTEAEFNHLPGVAAAISGFSGGGKVAPTYEEVSAGTTGHREAVLVY
jgi:hypothetical protein